ncbi:glycosyltransferase [Lederbergia panacisoli]|uniref:glycosyltransferase n=1 Tax=Lederbergia panacisoli TaxID=1255251 RepID=UPI00214AE247|nr:glycosyltransferase [Lederbergia panacisoli]MCR2822023.1 glycosyltransferase [Lederbergia panacisoli]
MKKKIIFMLINMNIGGTEKALLNMINEMSSHKYDITIFMLEEYGGFLEYIPPRVKVKYFNEYDTIKSLINQPPHLMSLQLFKNGKIIVAFIIFFLYIISKVLGNRSIYFQYLVRKYSPLENEYDLAVAYDGPMDFISYFVLKKIKAKKKIQWIHFDITKIGFNPKFAEKVYSKFDKVFVVSEEAKGKLIKIVPTIKNKTEVLINKSSPQILKYQSKLGEGFNDSFDGIRILTVGRLSSEKGQDIAIYVLDRLLKDGYKVKWYCVGDGPSKSKLKQRIFEYNLEENFILLGSNPNPYPYFDQCDIYVQPSKHEGFCITLLEAKYFRKPIVTTNFTGAKEQIKHGETGLIVDINEDAIYEGLKELLKNFDLRTKFSFNLAKETYENNGDLEEVFDSVV